MLRWDGKGLMELSWDGMGSYKFQGLDRISCHSVMGWDGMG